MEKTFVLLKPEAVARGLVGEITRRLEALGLRLADARLLTPSRQLAETHYGEEIERKYGAEVRQWLLDYICSGPVMAMLLAGPEAVALSRATGGDKACPSECAPGTIRGDLGDDTRELAMAEGRALRNLIHTSDSPESALREAGLWFGS